MWNRHLLSPVLVATILSAWMALGCLEHQSNDDVSLAQATQVSAAEPPLIPDLDRIDELPRPSADQMDQRDVVIIVLDDLGWGDLSFLGHPALQTPHLDQLANESIVATFAHSPGAYCTPSRAGMLTGKSPNRVGAYHWGHALRKGTKTMAHAFGEAGFHTMLVGKWHLGSVAKAGFSNPSDAGFQNWSATLNFHDRDPWFSRGGAMTQLRGEAADCTVDEALRLWNRETDQQRFMWLSFSAPHLPYVAPDSLLSRHVGESKKRAAYFAEVEALDAAMGRLIAELAPETVLLVVSDNGGVAGLSRTGGRDQKGTLYEGGLRVPFLLRVPGVYAAGTTHAPISGLDIFPTMLDLFGLPAFRHLDGHTLLGADGLQQDRSLGFWAYPAPGIRTPSDPQMAAFAAEQLKTFPFEAEQEAWSTKRDFPSAQYPGHSVWMEGRWKLHRMEHSNGRIKWALHNLAADSLEQQVSQNAEQDRFNRMQYAMQEWLASVLADMQQQKGR